MNDIQQHLGEHPILGVLGLGHVGLPTALSLAELGWDVVGADDNLEKTQRIARGEAPFFEPGLEELLRKHLDGGGFRVVDEMISDKWTEGDRYELRDRAGKETVFELYHALGALCGERMRQSSAAERAKKAAAALMITK